MKLCFQSRKALLPDLFLSACIHLAGRSTESHWRWDRLLGCQLFSTFLLGSLQPTVNLAFNCISTDTRPRSNPQIHVMCNPAWAALIAVCVLDLITRCKGYPRMAFMKQDPYRYPQQNTADWQHQDTTFPSTQQCSSLGISGVQQLKKNQQCKDRKGHLNPTGCNFINRTMLDVGWNVTLDVKHDQVSVKKEYTCPYLLRWAHSREIGRDNQYGHVENPHRLPA